MNRRLFTIPLAPRVLFILAIWIVALLISACSTSIQFTPQSTDSATVAKPNPSPRTSHDPHIKKSRFFAAMKPLVIAENARILEQRKQLLKLRDRPHLDHHQLALISALATQYGMTIDDDPDYSQWQALLARVDIIPLEMALVQAANESAWGESRFAREANNYFGQWCYQKGCGVVPKRRSPGATHEVRRFDSARASVRAYLHNINTGRAYAGFRNIRQSLRVQSKPLDAQLLVAGLKSYSERGMAYVRTIRAMIRSNRTLIANS